MLEHFPWLTTMIALPLVAALFIPLIPDKDGKQVRWYALGVGLADFVLMSYVFWTNYDISSTGFILQEKFSWIPQFGLSWSVSVDGISMPLVLLAGLVTTLSIFAAWQVTSKPRLFYFLMVLLYSAQIVLIVAQDRLLLLSIMWELELVPVYLLVVSWGGQKRQYAAMKFLLYTAAASVFILVAPGLSFYGDVTTFDIAELGLKDYPIALELFLYTGLALVAFAVKISHFPFHTWLPDAHGEASAPVSMILAGVLLKMGGYGLIRLNLGLLEDAHVYFAPILVILGVVNIIYGGFSSFAQAHKRRLAYSSVSHMGFVLLLFSITIGIMDHLQMLSHGLIARVLFFPWTGVTYDRTNTLSLAQMGNIGKVMPTVFALFPMGAMASLALPGMSGFVSELAVFVGVSSSDIYSTPFKTVTVFLAAVGLVLTPIYLLSMLRQLFYGNNIPPSCNLEQDNLSANSDQEAVCFGTSCVLPGNAIYDDARPREVFIAACLPVTHHRCGTLSQVGHPNLRCPPR
nr:NADH dehydrogenase subunit 4 [Synechocystis sp. PCC 6803]